MPNRIRQGDTVQILAGKDKGQTGEVIRVIPKKDRVLIRGRNMVKRHTKPTQTSPQGGIVDKELPLHLSNVMVVDPKDNKPTRTRIEERDGKKVRISTRTGSIIPTPTREAASSQ